MAKRTFFTSWQLWEEMTFVLAMGIVVVFLSGLIKLWSSNRQLRKVELLDAEKQARVTQMRKSGLSPNGRYRLGSEIPFGVKALESGVEVDGIWAAKMATMASQPPNRKWSSRRKAVLPSRPLVEPSNLGGPNKRARVGSRGSGRASKISRREIVEPSHQTREKLENLSLLEEAADTVGDEGARAASQGHKGPLGSLQRRMKKMTSLEMGHDQERKRSAGRVDVKEFHEQSTAKKPQRFYPKSEATSGAIAPLVAPKARSHTAQRRLENLLTAHGASQAGGVPREEYTAEGHPTVAAGSPEQIQAEFQSKRANRDFVARKAQTPDLKRRGSHHSSSSSAHSFVTSADVPEEHSLPVRVPGPHARRSSEDRLTLREAPLIPVRRSSRGSEHREGRQSARTRRSEERSSEPAQTTQPPNVSIPRYPPNSSRSGPVVQRSHSSSQHHKQQQQPASTPSSPVYSPGEIYTDAPERIAVNRGSEVPSAGTFGQSEEEPWNPVPRNAPDSAATSVRSSIDSQRSASGRRKLQKKRTRDS